uniref:Uncharacterized protein n=1 Tax=Octopus bimaculoides TaxID=37653 RepID=A0A0L8HIT3_OCTBM
MRTITSHTKFELPDSVQISFLSLVVMTLQFVVFKIKPEFVFHRLQLDRIITLVIIKNQKYLFVTHAHTHTWVH